MKTQIKQTIAKLSALAFVFALVVGVAPQSQAEVDATETVDINAEVVLSLQLAVDANSVDIQVDPDVNTGENMSGGTIDATDYTTTTVNTNNLAGYKLRISLAGAETTTGAVLDGSGTIASIPAGDFATENTFGYALNSQSETGAVTAFQYAATDLTSVDTLTMSGLDSATNSDSETIWYYLNVDYTTPADVYKGTVTYTAIAL